METVNNIWSWVSNKVWRSSNDEIFDGIYINKTSYEYEKRLLKNNKICYYHCVIGTNYKNLVIKISMRSERITGDPKAESLQLTICQTEPKVWQIVKYEDEIRKCVHSISDPNMKMIENIFETVTDKIQDCEINDAEIDSSLELALSELKDIIEQTC